MASRSEFNHYVLQLLEPIGTLRTSRFFGGTGISSGGAQFAMVMRNTLYFVVDDASRTKFQQAGMKLFSYMTKNGQVQVRRYFELPEEVLTDPQQLRQWALEAAAVALLWRRESVRLRAAVAG